jgi:hypothetical protein
VLVNLEGGKQKIHNGIEKYPGWHPRNGDGGQANLRGWQQKNIVRVQAKIRGWHPKKRQCAQELSRVAAKHGVSVQATFRVWLPKIGVNMRATFRAC